MMGLIATREDANGIFSDKIIRFNVGFEVGDRNKVPDRPIQQFRRIEAKGGLSIIRALTHMEAAVFESEKNPKGLDCPRNVNRLLAAIAQGFLEIPLINLIPYKHYYPI